MSVFTSNLGSQFNFRVFNPTTGAGGFADHKSPAHDEAYKPRPSGTGIGQQDKGYGATITIPTGNSQIIDLRDLAGDFESFSLTKVYGLNVVMKTTEAGAQAEVGPNDAADPALLWWKAATDRDVLDASAKDSDGTIRYEQLLKTSATGKLAVANADKIVIENTGTTEISVWVGILGASS